jgi:flavin reductase (DIM6/NTAB) family NADH-FMN oxidoreductase RutF
MQPDIAPRALRNALGRFATGVAIITCLDASGAPVGLTCNSFSALSLDPPLVLWSLRSISSQRAAFSQAQHFVVNVLGEAQVELSRRFAGNVDDRFDGCAWTAGSSGAPVFSGCAAVFECESVSQQTAGDHQLFIGRVLALMEAPVPPLVFQAGHYHLLGEVL